MEVMQRVRGSRFLLVSVCCLAQLGLSASCQSRFPPEYRWLSPSSNTSAEEEIRIFDSLPLEKQLEAAVLARRITHPPDQRPAMWLASRGEEILPFLLAALERETRDDAKTTIVLVVYLILRLYGDGDAHDRQVLERIERVISKMSVGPDRDEAKFWLEAIEEYPSGKGA